VARATRERYEPEVERYGGPWGFALAEELFHRQSETALALLGKIDPARVPSAWAKGCWPGAQSRTVPWHLLLGPRPKADTLVRSLKGLPVLGVEAILAKAPLHRPATLARSPAPLVHAATKAVRKAFYDAYAWFVAAFREAAERLRQGDRNAPFPSGSFPPALPFVAR